MLQRLAIRNFALIEQMNIEFKTGITVITGETGAGKSILIDALSILLGERASVEFIRHDKECFVIDGVFDISNNAKIRTKLEEKNILQEDDLLYISRSFNQKRKSLILINDQPVTLKTLREFGNLLADIHGQYSNQTLLDEKIHHEFLDYYNEAAENAFHEYQKAYKHYKNTKKQLETLEQQAIDRAREIDILKYQINEIADANVTLGEDESLTEEIKRFDNYERLYTTATSAYSALHKGRAPILDMLNTLRIEISDLTNYDPAMKEVAEMFSSAYFNVEEASHSLSSYIDTVTYDESRYAYCRQRDSLLYSLKTKYGPSLEDVLSFLDRASTRLETLENDAIEKSSLEKELSIAEKTAFELKDKLIKIRTKNNEEIVGLLHNTLKDLGMPKAKLAFAIDNSNTLTPIGANSIELVFAPNQGEGLRPLAKIASGGELSRIALAFSTVINSMSRDLTVFDEIDVGISGNVAIKVAEKLKSIATQKQILCITHMPQTVAIATNHYHLAKKEDNGRTVSTITALNQPEHIKYIAEMISGSEYSDQALDTVKDLIKNLN